MLNLWYGRSTGLDRTDDAAGSGHMHSPGMRGVPPDTQSLGVFWELLMDFTPACVPFIRHTRVC
jgi:hypothetical protein